MNIEGSVALVTGANRGIGLAFAEELLSRGASKVYAAARNPSSITNPALTPIELDVTDADAIERAAVLCPDVDLLINNAGIGFGGEPTVERARAEIEVNCLGTYAMSRAFAPVLAANGGGGLVNMLSVLSLISNPGSASYAASKAAAWSITNALRVELRSQGTYVAGIFSAWVDTDMVAAVDMPKTSPEDCATRVLDAVAAGEEEIFVDDFSRYVKSILSEDLTSIYPAIQQQYDATTVSA